MLPLLFGTDIWRAIFLIIPFVSLSLCNAGAQTNALQQSANPNRSIQPAESQWQAQCQCSTSWIKNQTDYWMAKWLREFKRTTARRASEQQSNATGANNNWNQQQSNARLGWDAKQSRRSINGNNNDASNNNSNHWASWIKPKGGNNANNNNANAPSGAHRHRYRLQHNQHQTPAKWAQVGERGPQGAKVSSAVAIVCLCLCVACCCTCRWSCTNFRLFSAADCCCRWRCCCCCPEH